MANFYPAIAAGFSMPVYEATQSAIHVLVTHAFLRSLAKLRLARSHVGRLRWLAGPSPGAESAETQIAAGGLTSGPHSASADARTAAGLLSRSGRR